MVLTVEEVHKRFGRLQVLRGASLSVERGEIVGIVGENGSGKTTLLRIIVGLITERSVDRYVVKAYVPTEQGIALYKKLVEEGAFPQRASAASATGGPSSQKTG